MNYFFSLLIVFFSTVASAADYARISKDQWQSIKEAVTEGRYVIDPQLDNIRVEVRDGADLAVYFFTKDFNQAHPGIIRLSLVRNNKKIGVKQEGWYAGDENKFKRWFQEIVKLPADQLRRKDQLVINLDKLQQQNNKTGWPEAKEQG